MNKKLKINSKSSLSPTKPKKTDQVKSTESKAKTQKESRSTQFDAGHEFHPQNRIRTNQIGDRSGAEPDSQSQIRRVSFIVRLTLDGNSQTGHTEIEHVPSGNKQSFPSLDGKHLVTFIKRFLSSPIIPDSTIPLVQIHKKAETSTLLSPEPKSNLVVSDIQVISSAPSSMNSTITHGKPFSVRVRFQLSKLDAFSIPAHGLTFEVKIYIHDITSGKSKILTTSSSELKPDVLQYEVHTQVPGLPSGYYRLFVLINAGKPIQMAGYQDGLILQII
jgi:hypothetical protein